MPWRRLNRQTNPQARAGPAATETADRAALAVRAATQAQEQLLAAAEAAFFDIFS
jgi:hypothetical protein